LWLLGETSGDLVWFDGPERHTRARVVDDPAGAELVVAGGVPVVVDRATRSVARIGPDGGDTARACVDMRGDDDSIRFGAAAGGDRVYAVSGDQGGLRVRDLATGGCASVAVTVADAGSDLGARSRSGAASSSPTSRPARWRWSTWTATAWWSPASRSRRAASSCSCGTASSSTTTP
jgi:hypothetical protein